MEFRRTGKRYFVETEAISERAFKIIFGEICDKDAYRTLVRNLEDDGYATMTWNHEPPAPAAPTGFVDEELRAEAVKAVEAITEASKTISDAISKLGVSLTDINSLDVIGVLHKVANKGDR